MLPRITYDDLVRSFKFYFYGKIHQAMTYEGEFYRLVKSFSASDKIHAHALACKISSQRIQTVITVSQQGEYKVWADVRLSLTSEPLPTKGFSNQSTRKPSDQRINEPVVHTFLVTIGN